MLPLSKCKLGGTYTISDIKGLSLSITRRLYELGLLSGQKLKFARRSLLGRAFLIEIRGYTLSLRSNIASSIFVER